MTSTTTTKSHFSTKRTAVYFGGLLAVAIISWVFLEIYPAGVAIAFNLSALLGIPLLLGFIGWRLWKRKESKTSAAIKSAGLVFLAFPILSGVALYAVSYLPTPSEEVLLRLANLSPAERGIDDVECARTGDNGFRGGKITCTFNVYVKGGGTAREYRASIDLQYKPGQNQWTRYRRSQF